MAHTKAVRALILGIALSFAAACACRAQAPAGSTPPEAPATSAAPAATAPTESTPAAPPASAPAAPAGSGADDNVVLGPPPPPQRRYLLIGINEGIFFPASSHPRDRFGSAWWSSGIGTGSVDTAPHGHFGIDLRTLYQESGNRNAFVGCLGIEYRHAFRSGQSAYAAYFVPYYGATADLILADLDDPEDHIKSSVQPGPGGSVFVGTTIGGNEFVELRYQADGSIEGFIFSGAEVDAGVRFSVPM
ncbi:MAG: hypothetical protein ACLQVD_14415 [Capsulimonadaceae bacterium]